MGSKKGGGKEWEQEEKDKGVKQDRQDAGKSASRKPAQGLAWRSSHQMRQHQGGSRGSWPVQPMRVQTVPYLASEHISAREGLQEMEPASQSGQGRGVIGSGSDPGTMTGLPIYHKN